MFILTNENVVFTKGENIELGRWENDPSMDTYRITNGDNYQYAVKANFQLYEVSSIPEDYEPNKYTYTESAGFALNPDWSDSQELTAEEILAALESEVGINE